MLKLAILFFILAATFGVVILTSILRDRSTSKSVIFTHGGFAAIGLVLLILAVIKSTGTAPILSLVLLAGAALGGLTLFSMYMFKKPIPKGLVLAHPLIAIIGLVSLILFVLK
jgi:hypothetical protein